jgi:hypothetical protein
MPGAARILADLIIVHPCLAFRSLEDFLDGPAVPGETGHLVGVTRARGDETGELV